MLPAKRPMPPRWRVGVAMIKLEVHSATSGLTAWMWLTLTPVYWTLDVRESAWATELKPEITRAKAPIANA